MTRPAAGALLRRARGLGATAVALPGLSLRVSRDPLVRTLLRASAFDDWIFSSPASVRFAFALAPGLRLPRRVRVFAVGDGTRRALARHGVDGVQVPAARSDSEGLLALPALAAMRSRRVALVGAPGGRGLIAGALARRGADVVPVHVYERRPPRLTRRNLAALACAAGPLFTLSSSAEALDNLVACLPAGALARLRRGTLVASSARLADCARSAGFARVVVARSPASKDLLECVRELHARTRR